MSSPTLPSPPLQPTIHKTHPTSLFPHGSSTSVFTPSTTLTIHAPITKVWSSLITISDWKHWNTFTPETYLTGSIDDSDDYSNEPLKVKKEKAMKKRSEDTNQDIEAGPSTTTTATTTNANDKEILTPTSKFSMLANMDLPTPKSPTPTPIPSHEYISTFEPPSPTSPTSQPIPSSTEPAPALAQAQTQEQRQGQYIPTRSAQISWAVNNRRKPLSIPILGLKIHHDVPLWWIRAERTTVLMEWRFVPAISNLEEPERERDGEEELERERRKKEVLITTVSSWESFGGLVTYLVKLIYGTRLSEAFENWGVELKGWCESVEEV